MIKAAFFDIDGTLLSHTSRSIPESTRRAIRALREKGILVVIATGRHIAAMKELPLWEVEYDGYITLNGQLCLDREERSFFEAPFLGRAAERLVELFRERKTPVALVDRDRRYMNFINEPVRLAHKAISSPLPATDRYDGKPLFQVEVYLEQEEEAALRASLPGCSITRWNRYAVDIIAEGGGKKKGIQAFLEQNGIRREETIAFGDGENDVDMLRFAGIGVAMGNADPCVKEAADYVTESVDEDGIFRALEAFDLLL